MKPVAELGTLARVKMHFAKRIAKFWALVVGLGVVISSCEPTSPVKEEEALKLIGFDDTPTISVQVNQILDDNWNIQENNNSNIAVLLVKTGSLNIVPAQHIDSGWTFSRNGHYLNNFDVKFAIGDRILRNKSNAKAWSEESTQFYAEDISYMIRVNNELSTVMPSELGPYTFRLVLQNDPAVGHWEIVPGYNRGTTFQPQSTENLEKRLSDEGSKYRDEIRQQIMTARDEGWRKIELGLAFNGILEKSKTDRFILIHKLHNIVYYVKPFSPGPSFTVGNLKRYCDNTIAATHKEYINWRVPTMEEMGFVLRDLHDSRAGAGRVFVDVPDGRLWGAVVLPMKEYNHRADILTSTLRGVVSNGGDGNIGTIYQPPSTQAGMRLDILQKDPLTNWYDAWLEWRSLPGNDLDKFPVGSHSLGEYDNDERRVICVASLS